MNVEKSELREGPYQYVTDLLVDTETCKRYAIVFSKTCPEEDKKGFICTDKFSKDWDNIVQPDVAVFHSWIADVRVATISVKDGRKTVMFQESLYAWC
jgi:hypothetical protein